MGASISRIVMVDKQLISGLFVGTIVRQENFAAASTLEDPWEENWKIEESFIREM